MRQTHIRKNIIISAMTGMMVIPGRAVTALAAENTESEQPFVRAAGIESALEKCYETDLKDNINLYLVPSDKGEYLNIAFSDTDDFTYIRSAPDENSDWTGKLYSDSTAQVLEYLDGWTKIRSGSAEGYVPTDTLITGADARDAAEEYETDTATVTASVLNVRAGRGTDTEVLTRVRSGETYLITGDPEDGWYPVEVGQTDGWVSGSYITAEASYSYGETKEEEAERAAEEKAREEAAKKAEKGREVINYACRFIGNPYVWGGTSLTDGADCSGFVQSVYAHFGVSLPRTTYDMEHSGYSVGYDEALPGDLVLYDGHVGLYMGDGNIVNAMNEEKGIGICSATYMTIIDVRRVL